ncbi:hypothetical protein ES705_44282 [subsurface metagenome]
MPKGCYWDSNKAIGFIVRDKTITILYVLGLLNSSLYNYLAKGIINNTNSIQITGIQALPIISVDNETKIIIEKLVNEIIRKKEYNPNYDYTENQKKIDDLIFNLYSSRFNFPVSLKKKLDKEFSIYR